MQQGTATGVFHRTKEEKGAGGLEQTSNCCDILEKYSALCGDVITANGPPANINKTLCTSANCMRQPSIGFLVVHVYQPLSRFAFVFRPLKNTG